MLVKRVLIDCGVTESVVGAGFVTLVLGSRTSSAGSLASISACLGAVDVSGVQKVTLNPLRSAPLATRSSGVFRSGGWSRVQLNSMQLNSMSPISLPPSPWRGNQAPYTYLPLLPFCGEWAARLLDWSKFVGSSRLTVQLPVLASAPSSGLCQH